MHFCKSHFFADQLGICTFISGARPSIWHKTFKTFIISDTFLSIIPNATIDIFKNLAVLLIYGLRTFFLHEITFFTIFPETALKRDHYHGFIGCRAMQSSYGSIIRLLSRAIGWFKTNPIRRACIYKLRQERTVLDTRPLHRFSLNPSFWCFKQSSIAQCMLRVLGAERQTQVFLSAWAQHI